MRLAPVVLYSYPDTLLARQLAAESSKTTHRAEECLDACRLMSDILCRALASLSREQVLLGNDPANYLMSRVKDMASGTWQHKSRDQIRGNGYVIDSLEAALWCCWQTDNFRDAVLLAANLGEDADTTAAVVGQIAGALYGERASRRNGSQSLSCATRLPRWPSSCRLCLRKEIHEKFGNLSWGYTTPTSFSTESSDLDKFLRRGRTTFLARPHFSHSLIVA